MGQAATGTKFVSRGPGYTVLLKPTEATLWFRQSAKTKRNALSAKDTDQSGSPSLDTPAISALSLRLLGANTEAKVTPIGKLPGVVNYLHGKDPARWRTNVSTYSKVRFSEVYPDIDLVYYGNQRQLEYDFIVSPKAKVETIRLALPGIQKASLDKAGNLHVGIAGGREVVQKAPACYQLANDRRVPVSGQYQLVSKNNGTVTLGFSVPKYDRSKPLYIDPVIYSTYLGASAGEDGRSVAADNSGNAYVTGRTISTNFPTTFGVFQTVKSGDYDAYVTKLNPSGTAVVYSTYIGGAGADDGKSIAVDSSGNAYVAGRTLSSDFPVFTGQTGYGGSEDAFIFKLNSTGTALIYSTFVGGTAQDYATGLALDNSGNVYVTGLTYSTNFPTTVGAYRTTYVGNNDCFVIKLNASGTGAFYSTYLGGTYGDAAYGIAVDSAGSAYVTGSTWSTNFPTTSGAYQTAYQGGTIPYDAFVTKLNPTGTALAYSTYLGGTAEDYGYAIAVDSSGNAYVAGRTYSANFPTTPGVFDTTLGGTSDAFITKLNASGSALVYSTYLGGTSDDQISGMAVDSGGNACVTGIVFSTNFPTTPDALQTALGGGINYDAFFTQLNSSGTSLLYSTYLGGATADQGLGVARDSSGGVYVVGSSSSIDFPTTVGSYQPARGAYPADAFVVKFNVPSATVTSKGTDFWLCMPEKVYEESPAVPDVPAVYLQISASAAANGTVEIPGLSVSYAFSVAANSVTSVSLPATVFLSGKDAIQNKGIHVTSNTPVSVVGVNAHMFVSDSYLGLPVNALGTQYTVLATDGRESQLAIVATQDNTTVTIDPSVDSGETTNTRLRRVPYTITLNTGEAYQLRSRLELEGVTGTHITSDKPVAVWGGARIALIPTPDDLAANTVFEQLIPSDRQGTRFLCVPLATRPFGTIVGVVAARYNTEVRLNGVLEITLRRGQFWVCPISAPVEITTSKPALVAQYGAGSIYDDVLNADPTMALLPAVSQYMPVHLGKTVVRSPVFYSHHLSLLVPSTATGNILLNGQATSPTFTAIGSSGYSSASLTLATGNYLVTTTTSVPITAIAQGFDGYDSYSHPTGLDLSAQTPLVQPIGAPTNLTATATSSSQINLAWTDNSSNEEGFLIQRKLPSSQSWDDIAIVGANVTSFPSRGLTPETAYQYRVCAFIDIESDWSNTASTTTMGVPPAAPSPFTATAVSQTQINLSWGDTSNETKYRIEWKQGPVNSADTWHSLSEPGANVTTAQHTGRTADTEYSYRLQAHNMWGDSPWVMDTARTFKNVPAAPTNLTATAISSSQINLAWTDNANNEEGFKIERATSSGGPWNPVGTAGENATTFNNTTGLTGGTTYYYRVCAYNSGGNSAWSNVASATTPLPPAPTAPSNLVAIAVSSTQISLTWTDNSNNETGFTVERKLGDANSANSWGPAGGSDPNTPSFLDGNRLAGTTYTYRVKAVNAGGSSGWSNLATATTAVSNAPAGLVATAVSPSQINLTWTIATTSGMSGYVLERTLGDGITNVNWQQIATPPANVTSYPDTDLMDNTTYTYRIKSVIQPSYSAWSNNATATTFIDQTSSDPNAPKRLNATSASMTDVNLSWKDTCSNETGFLIERKLGISSSSWTVVDTVGPNVTTYHDQSLGQKQTYVYRVKTLRTPADSAYSNEATAVTRWQSTRIGNGEYLVGTRAIVVKSFDPLLTPEQLEFYVDGEKIGSCTGIGRDTADVNGVAWILSDVFTTGTHTIEIRDDMGNTDRWNVTFNNVVQGVFVTDSFNPISPASGQAAAITVSAQVPNGYSWTVNVKTTGSASSVVRSYTGTSSSIMVNWNGRNAMNTLVPDDDYWIEITASSTANPASAIPPVKRRIRKESDNSAVIMLDPSVFYFGSIQALMPDPVAVVGSDVVDHFYDDLEVYKKYIDKCLKPLIDQKVLSGVTFIVRRFSYNKPSGQPGVWSDENDLETISRILASPIQLWYVASHGKIDDDVPYISWGETRIYSTAPAYTLPPKSIVVSDIVAPLEYGNTGSGFSPPKLVWIDTCNATGRYTTHLTFTWALVFGMTVEGVSIDGEGYFQGPITPVATLGPRPMDFKGADCWMYWSLVFWSEITGAPTKEETWLFWNSATLPLAPLLAVDDTKPLNFRQNFGTARINANKATERRGYHNDTIPREKGPVVLYRFTGVDHDAL